ncbi:hypothetical protein TNIN_148451 [Trichonephila inaurata madagascariensis]|uniref:Uncharacterized protein n=1 Tax=Trichonephila inaurata madagascariensis TaxID=2747483 RepID=A0A8X6JVH9_9ARAC|nr:hypothetical protein TNIN_148451 [Trichonephila inaurata madagascariensis]
MIHSTTRRSYSRLLSRHAHDVHDRVKGLRLPTLAKPSRGSHLRRRIQSTCSTLVAPRIHAALAFKFRNLRAPGTPCVVHLTDKQTGFSETAMEAFEIFSVRQASRRKSFPVQSAGLEDIPILYDVKKLDIGHFLISVTGPPYSRQKRKHNECRQPELL